MSPGGAGCSPRLLLTVGWLLLAGLHSACGANVTAAQDPGLVHEGEGEGEGEEEAEESESEGESEAENEAQSATEEDGEDGRPLDGDA
ncbi:Sperm acrosome membrane-associated protein 1 [Vulpes lagopus]